MRTLMILCALTLSAAVAASAHAQGSLAPPDTHRIELRQKPPGPSRKELVFAGTAGSTMVAVGSSLSATVIYWLVCPSRHRDDAASTFDFGRCAFPTSETVATTWLAGAFVGAAGLSTTVAIQRGCRRRDAILRTMAGAAVGSLPGIIAYSNSRHSDRYPASRSRLITFTPLTAGLGSALAVADCHRP